MGMGITTIRFERGLPLLPDIQAAFFNQTGLRIYLTAAVNILPLTTSPSEILLLLKRDAEVIAKLEEERKNFAQANPQQYEAQALLRDSTKEKKALLNHIIDVSFIIPGFYSIEFRTQGNTLEVDWFLSQYYGVTSLKKVLVDLGGNFIDSDVNTYETPTKKWRKLKRWDEYKWYNRPKK